jgi:CRP-like cAMP-binding protein
MSSSIQDLCRAIAQNTSYDAFAPALNAQQWETVAGYLQPFDLAAGQVLIDQGAQDRTVFMIESGALSVHLIGDSGQMQLAILNPGSVVGEGSFFSRAPRSANVVATGAARVWRLTGIRFAVLSNRQPNLALELTLGLGAVIAKRLVNKQKRVAVT